MKTHPTHYRPGQTLALRWRAIGTAAPGIYTLLHADGTPHGASWHPRFSGLHTLPPIITVWAEITHKTHQKYTLTLPTDLGGGHITLTATEIDTCRIA